MLSPARWSESYLKRLQSRRGLGDLPLPAPDQPDDSDVLLQHDAPTHLLGDDTLPISDGDLRMRTSSTPLLQASINPRERREALELDSENGDRSDNGNAPDDDSSGEGSAKKGLRGCFALWQRDRSEFWAQAGKRWPYYTLPIVLWIRHYQWKRFSCFVLFTYPI